MLRSVMLDGNAPTSSRVSAAKAFFELALKDRNAEQFEQRLAAIEEKLGTHAQL